MELSIKNLAIPRKQPVITKTASCTWDDTTDTFERMSASLPDVGNITYYPRLYKGTHPSSGGNWLCYAYVYTNGSDDDDTTKGLISYNVIETDQIVDGYTVLKIRCDKPDGTYFIINPGYYLGSGLYCVGITFMYFRYAPRGGGSRVIYDDSTGFKPQTRRTKTSDYENFECALPTAVFDITVQIDVYNASRHEMADPCIVNGIDSDSYMGRGGLYAYRLCCGADYKDKNAAAIDPSGKWYTENITRRTDIDVQYDWT